MVPLFNIGQMLAGIAIFMLGMQFMEDSLRALAGRPFKLFLKKQTSNRVKAVAGGTIFSAVMQSSSVVNLLVLSLVGAGVIQLQHALAVLLGSNLGTTVTSWVIATIGFNFNIEMAAYLVTGITGISMAFFTEKGRLYHWTRFLLGFSFLFVGLGFIKGGMMEVMMEADLSMLDHYPVIAFVIAGMLITGIIQSSSATVAIALSALYANAVSLYAAMAIVLGSEIGTTFKLFLASANGSPDKKRMALGNFMFNILTVSFMLALLGPVYQLITGVFKINDNLLALVFFQSMINVTGILLFFPWLGRISNWLEKRFASNEDETLYIHKVNLSDADIAREAFEKETLSFLHHVFDFCLSAANLRSSVPDTSLHWNFHRRPIMEKYEYIKKMHGEIHGFYLRLQKVSLPGKDTERQEQLISSVRNSMYAAKSMKDALPDIEQMHNSSNDTKYNFYLQVRDKVNHFTREVMALLDQHVPGQSLGKLTALYREMQQGYARSLEELYREGMEKHLSESEISTLINFNRETYTVFKSVAFSMKDYMLDTMESDKFDELPGFIR